MGYGLKPPPLREYVQPRVWRANTLQPRGPLSQNGYGCALSLFLSLFRQGCGPGICRELALRLSLCLSFGRAMSRGMSLSVFLSPGLWAGVAPCPRASSAPDCCGASLGIICTRYQGNYGLSSAGYILSLSLSLSPSLFTAALPRSRHAHPSLAEHGLTLEGSWS